MTAYQPYPPPYYAPPTPRNGLGLAALILGLVALPFTLTGLTAWIAIILGTVAVPLALAGLGRIRRHQASNPGTTIAGLILGLLVIVLGIASSVATINALDKTFSTRSTTVEGGQQAAAGPHEQASEPVALGTTINVDGLNISVTKIVSRVDVGKRLTCAEVSYANPGPDVADRSPLDWSARNPRGASVNSWLYTNDDALDSGELASGGNDSGIVCFDVPRDEVAVIQYKSNIFNDGPDAEWSVS